MPWDAHAALQKKYEGNNNDDEDRSMIVTGGSRTRERRNAVEPGDTSAERGGGTVVKIEAGERSSGRKSSL